MANKHIVVVGGGPAGTEAALAAARHGTRVTLVTEKDPGDWSKLLPSRIWLTAQQQAKSLSRPPLSDGEVATDQFDFEVVRTNVHRASESWHAATLRAFEALGVECVRGTATFRSEHEIEVSNDAVTTTLEGDTFIVTVGSAPTFPPGLEPDGKSVYSPATVEAMSNWPSSIIVVGDGPIGFEFVEMFSFAGVEVLWFVLGSGPTSTWGHEADELLLRALSSRDVRIHAGLPLKSLERSGGQVAAIGSDGDTRAVAEAAFVNVGARSAVGEVGLERVGVAFDERGFVQTSDVGQTSVPTIYVVGDARQPTAAGLGMAEARVAAAHAAGADVDPATRYNTAYSFGLDPQVAKVGRTGSGDGNDDVMVPYTECLTPHFRFDEEGFLKLYYDSSGIVTGGLAVGRLASEVITPVEMAVRLELSLEQLAACQGAHPCLSELPFIAARKALSRRA